MKFVAFFLAISGVVSGGNRFCHAFVTQTLMNGRNKSSPQAPQTARIIDDGENPDLRGSTTKRLSSAGHYRPHRHHYRWPMRRTTVMLKAMPVPSLVLPSVKTVALSCLLPTSLGFYKSEYGVSYGYGTSVALVALGVLKSLLAVVTTTGSRSTNTNLAIWHAAALIFYGVRLDLFLLYRELFLPRFRELRERIEDRAKERGNRLQRTPFIVSCAALYAWLAAPLWVSAPAAAVMTTTPASLSLSKNWAIVTATVLVGCTWAGFLVAALGDLQKSIGKAQKGEDTLITDGILKYLRHPNYTGEAIGWTCSYLVALVLALFGSNSGGSILTEWKRYATPLFASTLGLSGILLILARATNNLERRQKEKYGDTEEYKEWVKRSWKGISLPPGSSSAS